METQRILVTQRREDLPAVVDLVEGQVAARQRGFDVEALRMAAGGQHAPVERRLRPADVGLEVGVAVALAFDELDDFVDRIQTGLNLVLLRREPVAEARVLADRVTKGQAHAQAVHRVAGDAVVQLVIVGAAVEGVVARLTPSGVQYGSRKLKL